MADAMDKRTMKEIAAEEMELAREETDELEATMREMSIRFSEAFDNMPPVPRPLPPEYKFISVKALMVVHPAHCPLLFVGPSEMSRISAHVVSTG